MTKFIYLHGFASSPSSKKATAFKNKFNEIGLPLEIPDLEGGNFENMTLTSQMNTLFHSMDKFKNSDVCIIGSSMGAYLAILAAQDRINVHAVYLMAPGFNFLNRWMRKLNLDYKDEALWKSYIPIYHYRFGETRNISSHIFKDALIWSQNKLTRELPTRIIHGIHDQVVPIHESRKFITDHPWCSLSELNADHGLLTHIDWIINDCIFFLKTQILFSNK